jgi:hypothetical protein
MPSLDPLVSRVRGEYLEMPGLRLTVPQACRLWHVDASACEAVLLSLMADGFLKRTRDGAFQRSADNTRSIDDRLPVSVGRRSA